jgi:hypothetical protein
LLCWREVVGDGGLGEVEEDAQLDEEQDEHGGGRGSHCSVCPDSRWRTAAG